MLTPALDRFSVPMEHSFTRILETRRLFLRELVAADLDFLAAMLGDAEVMRHYPKPLSRTEAEAWLNRQRARYEVDGHGLWLAVERASGRPVGQVGLVAQRVDAFGGAPTPEIGYLLQRADWGRGYATEAALGVRTYAFEQRGYPTVISLIRPENTASQAVARRLGMRVIAETAHAGHPHLVFGVDADQVESESLDRHE
jgi:RimJ/RimL family protein N-acetyltransferase